MTPPDGLPDRFTQRFDRTLIWIILALELGSIVMTVALLGVIGAQWHVWLLVLAGLALAPALVCAGRLRLTLRDDHLRWVFFPFWAGRVRYEDIEDAQPVRLDPMGDFGGWGPKLARRSTGLGFGLVARGPLGVRIDRRGRRPLTVTTDDPETFALALLTRCGAHAEGERGAGAASATGRRRASRR